MTPDYELLIRRDGTKWKLMFTQGSIRKEVTITSLSEIVSFLRDNLKEKIDE